MEIEIEKGNLGMTMGISLALERMLGMGEKEPSMNYVLNDVALSISVTTILRDILQSLPTPVANKIVLTRDFITMDKLLEEQMAVIKSMNRLVPYKSIRINIYKTHYPRLKIDAKETISYKKLMYMYEYSLRLTGVKVGIPKQTDLLMCVTPFDIIQKRTKVLVVNTNTGDIITNLYSKLKIGKTYNTFGFPFNAVTLEAFGDKYGYVKGYRLIQKRDLANLFIKEKVNPNTSLERCKVLLKRIKR